MEKTSREYAYKMAMNRADSISQSDKERINCIADVTSGYMLAVEETNVKELIEALDKIMSICNPEIESHSDFYHIAKASLQKAKEVK